MPKTTSKNEKKIDIRHIEIEITSSCNMHCQHCRSPFDYQKELSPKQIDKILNLIIQINGSSNNPYCVVLEGGEPFMHSNLLSILQIIKKHEKNGCKRLVFFSNGSKLTKLRLEQIKKLDFNDLSFVFSLDHYIPKEHDSFRNHKGSYEKIIKSIELIKKIKIPKSKIIAKTSFTPELLEHAEKMSEFVKKIGFNEWQITDIQPLGRALKNNKFFMRGKNKKKYLKTICKLIKNGSNDKFKIKIFDPLTLLVLKENERNLQFNNIGCFNCTAGINYFSVKPNGDISPCELMDMKIININDGSVKKLSLDYTKSLIVKNLIERNLIGKCKNCKNKNICQGCRARAWSVNKNYLASDPDCWL